MDVCGVIVTSTQEARAHRFYLTEKRTATSE